MNLRTALLAALLAGTGGALLAADLTAQQSQGKRLYDASCRYCHGPDQWATQSLALRLDAERADIETRTDLTPDYIRLITRNGIGSMPWYPRTHLTDDELAAIIAYLTRER